MRSVRRLGSWLFDMIGVAALIVGTATTGPGIAQESVAVRAVIVKEGVPGEGPSAAAWNTVPVSEFPLSPQVHWPTRIGEVTAKSVKFVVCTMASNSR